MEHQHPDIALSRIGNQGVATQALARCQWQPFQFAPLLALISAFCCSPAADALDYIQLQRHGRTQHVSGKLIVEAQDGGLLLQAPDGVLWAVEPDELVKHTSDDEPFAPADAEALSKKLLEELGDGFSIHTTAHYVIAYNTSKAYAQWCGALYERLYASFYNYWERRGLKLVQPQHPLVAVVFDRKESYIGYARPELGEAAEAIPGYYNLQSNRIAMYDLTAANARGSRRGTMAQINAVLARPEAAANVATIIHEATHQLAFNSGIHQRLADIPKWLSEGFAMFFETPDLESSKGWRTIGGINRPRLVLLRQSLAKRPADSLTTLLASDARFLDTATAQQAYAEAWALNYYLINKYPKTYHEYLKRLGAKGALLQDTPEERLAEFREVFAVDLETLERDFLKYVRNLGP
jgi:hypothetical protein